MDPELWIRRPALALASLAPILLGGAWMAVARELPLLRGRPGLAGGLTWALTRALPAALLWGVAGFASLDLRATLLPQAHAALAGGVPYRDYASAFSPLLPPLLAATTLVAGRLGPPLLFLAADLAAWRALAAGEGEAGEAAWAYVAMPVVWYPLIRYQDGGALGAMFVALAFVAMRRGRAAAAGLALAGGLLFTRPLFLLPALACLLGAPAGRRRMAAWAAAPVALVGAVLLAR
ncbi:MAG TPA: hypothetical protein VGU27_06795, partial [Candidatus Eisenbacteria bacterium]|nr:hypothetical protein [Candidatus Eisenbacteria bacterium]